MSPTIKILLITILVVASTKALPTPIGNGNLLQATSEQADDLKASEQFYRPYGYPFGFGYGGYPIFRAYPGRFYGRYYGGYPFHYG